MKKLINIVLLFLSFSLYSQTIASTQSHEGKVNALLSSETESSSDNSFYSVGNDGFIIKWTSDGMGDHYQVSDLQVRLVAKNPVYGDIAVYETDGVSNHRLTVIDSKTYAKKFSSFNFVFSKGKISFCRNNGGKRNFCSKCAHWNCNKKSNRCFRNCSAHSNRRFRKNCRHVLKIRNALLLRFNRNESQGEIFRTKLIDPAYTFWHREFQKQIYCRRKKQYNIYNRCDFRQNTCSVSGKFADHFHF